MKIKKLVTISLVIFWVFVVAIIVLGLFGKSQPAPAGIVAGGTTITLTPQEIAKHNQPADCWLIINNKVYNVTQALSFHPGGVGLITRYCGQEATQAFDTKDLRFPTSHSPSAVSLLADYFLGDLNQTINSTAQQLKGAERED